MGESITTTPESNSANNPQSEGNPRSPYFALPDTDPHFSSTSAPLAVFWDMENCPVPQGTPGFIVVEQIRRTVHHFGRIVRFIAYGEYADVNRRTTLLSELQSSGVTLSHVPHNGRKDSVDKCILVDMMTFAMDVAAPATIVLVSGDRDFVYGLATLRNRRYTCVLIVPQRGAPIVLRAQCNTILEWRYDVLREDAVKYLEEGVAQGGQWPSAVPDVSNVNNNNNSNNTNTNIRPKWTHVMNNGKLSHSSSQSSLTESSNPLTISTTHKPTTTDPDALHHYLDSPKAPGFFDLLIEVLEQFRLAGDTQPLRSRVGHALVARNPLLYQRAGVQSFKDYVELAQQQGIIQLGGDKHLAWMSLME